MTTRRTVLTIGAGVAALCAFRFRGTPVASAASAEVFSVAHTDVEWRKILTSAQYEILREGGTEPPFTSPLLHEERQGIFACAGCSNDLFSSKTKFDSGTGWPSFWTHLDGAVGETRDTTFGMERIEVHCARCGGHLGHVFNDGPNPTGLRYCMDGLALAFKPAAAT